MFCAITFSLIGQPTLNKRLIVNDNVLYQDFYDEHCYYYLPGKLKLATEHHGVPRFKLLQMRYTGTKMLNDSGEKSYLNIAKVTAVFSPMDKTDMKGLKEQVKILDKKIKLRPLSIKYMETILVAPYLEVNSDTLGGILGSSGVVSNDIDKSTWNEKTFTLKLDNYQANLLWNQLELDQLTLSLSYAFYVDAFPVEYQQLEFRGDSVLLDHFQDFLEEDSLHEENDSTIQTLLIASDAFAINVDTKRWPDVLKQIDLNAEKAAAYPVLEIRCYDFHDQLRPDLYKKVIKLKAIGAGGDVVQLSANFAKKYPEVVTKYIQFPFAVDITQPYQFRVIEYSLEGNKSVWDWEIRNNWIEQIDITTADSLVTWENWSVDIQTDWDLFTKAGLQEILVIFEYKQNGELIKELISFLLEEDFPVQSLEFQYDKRVPIKYFIHWKYQNGIEIIEEEKILREDYLFLKPIGNEHK